MTFALFSTIMETRNARDTQIYKGKIMRKNAYVLHRLAAVGVLTAMSLIAFVVESMFPPLFVPGAKIGFSNLFSLIALVLWSPAEACAVFLCRTLLGGLIFGNAASMAYGLAAGGVALAVSSLLLYGAFPRIGFVSVSVCAAIVHNLVQNAIFCAMSGVPQAWIYLPYLVMLGAISGTAVGAAGVWIVRALPERIYEKTLRPLRSDAST